MFLVAHQAHMEQAVAVDVERLDEVPLFLLNILNFLDGEGEFLVGKVNGLNGFAGIVKLDAGEQCGVRLKGGDYGLAQAVAVEAAVKHIDVGQVVAWLALMAGTLHI